MARNASVAYPWHWNCRATVIPLVHRCGLPRLVARYPRVRAIEQHELGVGGPKIPKDQSVGDDVLEHVLNPSRMEPLSSQMIA